MDSNLKERDNMGFLDFVFTSKTKDMNKNLKMLDETASELSPDGIETLKTFRDNGIILESTIETFKLDYNGLLAKNGAHEVSLMVGYGDQNNWEYSNSFPMKKLDNQFFEVYFPITEEGNVHLAFKDSADNWDNNSGENYTFIQG